MEILVCVKQVPRPDEVRFRPGVNRVVREGVARVLNPLDEYALGHAFALRARAGGRVTAATMGPLAAREVLVDAMRAGADRAIHLVDGAFAGADTLATARALAALVERERPDLVLLGRGSIDGGTSQVAPQLAELTGLPIVSHAVAVHVSGTALVVTRECERGAETWLAEPPAIVSVERGPRPARSGSGDGPVEEVSAADLGEEARFGIRGSATYVQRIVDLERDRAGTRIADPPVAAARIHALARVAVAPGPPPESRHGKREIWVVAEAYRGRLHPVTAEGLAAAHAVAGRLDATVIAVLPCAVPGDLPGDLAGYGADRVLVVRDPALGGHGHGPLVDAVAGLVGERSPFAVVGAWTADGRDWVPRVAARLSLGLTGDVVGLDTDPNPGDPSRLDLVWLKPAWAGGALARVVARTIPSLGTLRPGVVVSAAYRAGRRISVETVESPWAATGEGARLLRTDETPHGLVDAARVLICVGERTMPATLEAARALAAATGWGIAGTPGAVAAGLVDPAAELSPDRRSLAPSLVVAVGVAEAADLDAVRGAETIAIIGPPRTAPAHEAADLAVLAEPLEVIAALHRHVAEPAGAS